MPEASNEQLPVSITRLTPLSFLERSARVWPDKLAIVDGDTEITYAEFGDRVQQLASALQSVGVKPGDRVAFLMPNVSEMLLAHFAVPLVGGVLVAVNTRLSSDEIEYILQHSGASVFVVDPRLLETGARAAAELSDRMVRVVSRGDDIPEGWRSWADFVAGAGSEPLPWTVPDENGPIAINYTSGTTGRPKGVVYTHRGAYLNSFGELLHSRHTVDSVYLWTLPMFHCNGWCTPWAITAIGGTHVCLPDVRGDQIWSLIRERRVTHLNGAPTVLTMMSNAPEAAKLDHPVVITTAGAPPSPTTIAQMEGLGFELVHVYGLTETYGPYSVCEIQSSWADETEEQRFRFKARQGVGMIQAEQVRVVDFEMNDVAPDGETMGEIVMRGNNVMQGYYLDPEGTETAFKGGWFHSGDLGVMHPDGYVELRDRAKDVVISGGENISTVEVEQAVISHPAVLECAVVGVPDEKWGERPRAYVVLKNGREATGPEIVEHVRVKIAKYKAPREVEIVDELPKTSTGKIQKFVLRNMAWEGHEKRIQG